MNSRTLMLIGLALGAGAAHAADPMTPHATDNSGINERDRSSQTLTADDQSQAKRDVELTAKVRRAVVKQPGLSMNGQNIKIITVDNAVTLRGPVKDDAERIAIERTARAAAGTAIVNSRLELK